MTTPVITLCRRQLKQEALAGELLLRRASGSFIEHGSDRQQAEPSASPVLGSLFGTAPPPTQRRGSVTADAEGCCNRVFESFGQRLVRDADRRKRTRLGRMPSVDRSGINEPTGETDNPLLIQVLRALG